MILLLCFICIITDLNLLNLWNRWYIVRTMYMYSTVHQISIFMYQRIANTSNPLYMVHCTNLYMYCTLYVQYIWLWARYNVQNNDNFSKKKIKEILIYFQKILKFTNFFWKLSKKFWRFKKIFENFDSFYTCILLKISWIELYNTLYNFVHALYIVGTMICKLNSIIYTLC